MQKIILAIAFMLFSSGTIACSCVVSDPSFKATIRSHEALVWVKTLSREKVTTGRGEYYKTKVSIVEFWKGDSSFGEYYVMTETEESSSCGGPPLNLEDELLVYAWAQEGGLLYTGGCSSYSPVNLESTKNEIKKLNKYFRNT